MENNRSVLILMALIKHSSEHNILSTNQLLDYLDHYGVKCSRRTILRIIKDLNKLPLNIISSHQGYYLEPLIFNKIELKVLVDALISASFLPDLKKSDLVNKLLSLINEEEQKHILKSTYQRKNKVENTIFYNLNELQYAIEGNYNLTFKYYDLNYQRQKIYRQNSKQYEVYPLILLWKNERYYCLAYSKKHDNLVNYRVDKMNYLKCGKDSFPYQEKLKQRLAKYIDTGFNMTYGKIENITIKFHLSLLNQIFDQFGENALIKQINQDYFLVNINTVISNNFLSYIMQYGNKATILKPQSCIKQLHNLIQEIKENY